MTVAVLVIAALALGIAAAAIALSLTARNDAAGTRNELARHRHSHTLQQPDAPARRHGTEPGPAPRVDEHAAPPTSEMPALQPPGTRRVRDDPQA